MTDADAHDAATAPLATGPRGMKLLSFSPGPEGPRHAGSPVSYVLVVLRHEDRVLMVHVRHRGCWELPGGGIEPGETAREAAVREVWEEAGQRLRPEDLRFAGFCHTELGQRVLWGGVFTARTAVPQPFVPNEEVSAAHWRTDGEPMPGGGAVQTVDEYLIRLCGDA